MKRQFRSATEKLRVRKLLRRREWISDLFLILGVLAATVGLKCFLLPKDYLDGGVTGISLLLNRIFNWDISILITVINLPFVLIGWQQIGRNFALKTAASILALALLVHYVNFPTITSDPLLISVFGGFFIGCGIGLSMRGGAVIDGTEVLAVYVSRKSSLSVGDFIAGFNVLIFISAAFFVSLEIAMYSMLTYLAASKTVDFIITGIEEYIGVTIISDFAPEIHTVITQELGMAVTVYKGEGGFGKSGIKTAEKQILYSVVTRLEVQKLTLEVEKIDANAFVIQHTINDTRGGMIKKRPLH